MSEKIYTRLGLLGVILLLMQALACSEPKSTDTSKSENKPTPPAQAQGPELKQAPGQKPSPEQPSPEHKLAPKGAAVPKIPHGAPYTFEEAGLKFEVPEKWKAEKNEKGY